MGLAMEVLAGFATAPSVTFTGLTMGAGNSLTIRNARPDSKILLLQAWADFQGASGLLQIRSPRLHDNVKGLRFGGVTSEVKPLLPDRIRQPLMPQDTLIAEVQGSAVGGDIETACMLVYYEDLPGADGRFISESELIDRMVNVACIENTLALGTVGGYSGEEAINAEQDLLKANTDYALIGYLTTVECALLRWRGADTGNMGVGGPGDELGRDYTRSWFLDLARKYQMPMIPVFNSANRAGILLDGVQDENGADPLVTSIFAELAPRASR